MPKILCKWEEQKCYQFKWSQDNWLLEYVFLGERRRGMGWMEKGTKGFQMYLFYFLIKANKILILIKLGRSSISTHCCYSLCFSLYSSYFIPEMHLKVGMESDSTLCLPGKLWNNHVLFNNYQNSMYFTHI